MRIFERGRLAKEHWTAEYGHIRPYISTDFSGRKLVAAGPRICFSSKERPWRFVTDFLMDYIPSVFGAEWCNDEIKKPATERHPVIQWRIEGLQFANTLPRQSDGTFFSPFLTGPLSAYLAFAFDVFAIEDNSRLDESLIKRLKHPDQFQGAMHEVFAEATCLRGGFSIEHENERDGLTRHAEFTAKHKATGQLFSVEAKSRHRAGVLGRPGVIGTDEELNMRFGDLLNDAIAKNPPNPLVIFLDTNLPFQAAEKLLGRGNRGPHGISTLLTGLLDRDRKIHGGKDLYAMLVFTNHPNHYAKPDEQEPSRHTLAIIPDERLASPATPAPALQALLKAANQYGKVPIEFPKPDNV